MQLKSFFMVDTDPSTSCYTLAADYLLTCLLKCMHPKNYAQGLCFLWFVGVGIYVNYTHILQGYITGTERFSNCPSVTMKKHCWQLIDGTWECNNNGLNNKNKIKENSRAQFLCEFMTLSKESRDDASSDNKDVIMTTPVFQWMQLTPPFHAIRPANYLFQAMSGCQRIQENSITLRMQLILHKNGVSPSRAFGDTIRKHQGRSGFAAYCLEWIECFNTLGS